MDNETLFYVFGIGTAISAVLVSFVGLKVKSFPGRAFPIVILWFAILVGGATTFSVLHAQDEEHHKEAELEHANEVFEAEGHEEPGSKAAAEAEESGEAEHAEEAGGEAAPAAKGPGGTLQLAADPSALAYDKKELMSKPGKVTIDFTNPAALEHDVAIEDKAGEELAGSELISESETTVSADLANGTYTFFCTVPGHREAGMEGTLSVK
ncbi:MAG TPA: plastocyanin/azurin family copper-binding protein [Solirubrobacterales bacterium]|nr:plastocyanin/azurin family copper-binding protein [Solirubrobacterales bacterium]